MKQLHCLLNRMSAHSTISAAESTENDNHSVYMHPKRIPQPLYSLAPAERDPAMYLRMSPNSHDSVFNLGGVKLLGPFN